MLYKYTLPSDYAKRICNNKIQTVSYTEFENEPSLIHSHKHATEIIFVKSGEGSIVYRDTEIEIKPNTVYFINPNTDHTELSKNKLKYFVMRLRDFEVLDEHKIPIKSLEISSKDYKTFLFLLETAIEEYRTPSYDEDYVISLFSSVFFGISHIVKNKSSLSVSENTLNFSSTVQSCINYIDLNFSKISSVDELCLRFNISQRNLERLFKKELGLSPIGYVKRVKLQKAQALLTESNYSVSQISAMCGFASFAYFSKEFKYAYGQTPSDYRKKTENV